jgi:hypothetical protein
VSQRRDSSGGRDRGIAYEVTDFQSQQGARYVGDDDLSVTNCKNVMAA